MSCKIFTSIVVVRTSAEHSPYRPSASYRTGYLTRDLYLLSRISARRVFSREEHAERLSALRRIGTKDNRRMSCNVRNTALRNHAPRYFFFHANLTPSARRPSARGYVKSACDRFAEYRVKYEIVRPRKMRRELTRFLFFKSTISAFCSFLLSLAKLYIIAIFDSDL